MVKCGKMANRTKTKRNIRILKLWDDGKGWRQKSIARMMKMKESTVSMVIHRAQKGGQAISLTESPGKCGRLAEGEINKEKGSQGPFSQE